MGRRRPEGGGATSLSPLLSGSKKRVSQGDLSLEDVLAVNFL
jgi:hypothetical protein